MRFGLAVDLICGLRLCCDGCCSYGAIAGFLFAGIVCTSSLVVLFCYCCLWFGFAFACGGLDDCGYLVLAFLL